jgi:hypothetical protein
VNLDKACSVCGSLNDVEIETVTNVIPQPDDMFPVLLCRIHKQALQDRRLDIRLDASRKLTFILKDVAK